jgi:hypothetical protein
MFKGPEIVSMVVAEAFPTTTFSLDYSTAVVEVDRRQDEREACDLTAVATAVSGPRLPTLTARVPNVSDGGLALATSRPVPEGTILRLALRDAKRAHGEVVVRVVHATRRPTGGWLLGCAFLP